MNSGIQNEPSGQLSPLSLLANPQLQKILLSPRLTQENEESPHETLGRQPSRLKPVKKGVIQHVEVKGTISPPSSSLPKTTKKDLKLK